MHDPETDSPGARATAQLPPTLREWWERALEATAGELDRGRFASSYTVTSRKAGREDVDLGDPRGPRPLDHQLREILLARALRLLPENERATFVHRLFETGDNREREALLQALPALPDPAGYLETAVEACRTNVVTVFTAIACENSYPETHFPEANFNQMVLKAIFLGVPTSGILGLDSRSTAELARMARGFAEERRAAGRVVPADAVRLAGEENENR